MPELTRPVMVYSGVCGSSNSTEPLEIIRVELTEIEWSALKARSELQGKSDVNVLALGAT